MSMDAQDSVLITTPFEAVKAVGKGVVKGKLIRFTGPNDTDVDGEFFAKDTDYGADAFPVKTRLYFHHGMDPVFGKKSYGSGKITRDDEGDEPGIDIVGTLDMEDKKAQRIFTMAENGELGWSSGAVLHLIVRETVKAAGKSVRKIVQWPLGEASLTPMPAEPRNVVATKSLSSLVDPESFKTTLLGQYDNAILYLELLRERHNELKSLRESGGEAFKASEQYRWRLARILDLAKCLQAELAPLPEGVAPDNNPNELIGSLEAEILLIRNQQMVSPYGGY